MVVVLFTSRTILVSYWFCLVRMKVANAPMTAVVIGSSMKPKCAVSGQFLITCATQLVDTNSAGSLLVPHGPPPRNHARPDLKLQSKRELI